MKRELLFVLGLVGLLFIAACSSTQSSDSGEENNVDDQITLTGETKEFRIEAFQFAFEPNIIEVNYGDKVKLVGASRDVPHGLALPEFGVNLYLDGLNEDSAEFVASKRGEFTFYCSVPCGRGHGSMQGKLIVK